MVPKIFHFCDCFAGLWVKNSPRNREGLLWIYGDSNAGRFYRSNASGQNSFSELYILTQLDRYRGGESKKFFTYKHISPHIHHTWKTNIAKLLLNMACILLFRQAFRRVDKKRQRKRSGWGRTKIQRENDFEDKRSYTQRKTEVSASPQARIFNSTGISIKISFNLYKDTISLYKILFQVLPTLTCFQTSPSSSGKKKKL